MKQACTATLTLYSLSSALSVPSKTIWIFSIRTGVGNLTVFSLSSCWLLTIVSYCSGFPSLAGTNFLIVTFPTLDPGKRNFSTNGAISPAFGVNLIVTVGLFSPSFGTAIVNGSFLDGLKLINGLFVLSVVSGLDSSDPAGMYAG